MRLFSCGGGALLALIAFALLLSCAGFMAVTEPSPGEQLAAAGHRVIAYYPGWTSQGRNPYQVEDIPGHLLTHINYAFANVGAESGQIALGYPHLDVDRVYPGDPVGISAFGGNFRQMLALKERHPHLKTLISVGGWTWSGNFPAAAESDEKRRRFARSCAAFASRYGFDGVDIDWEYPNSEGMQPGKPEDRRNFTLLLQALREALDTQAEVDGREYLLTFASPGGIGKIDALEVDEIHKYLDFINVMTYDFAGSWSAVTQFNSPLYGTTDPTQLQDPHTTAANADAVLKHLLAAGVPPQKLVMGLPFNGKSFAGVHDANEGLYQTFDSSERSGIRTSWRALQANDLYGMRRRWHEEAKSPWLYDAHKGITVVYEDPVSARLKTEYVRDHGLGGVMFWQITSDDDDHSMVQALVSGLLGRDGESHTLTP